MEKGNLVVISGPSGVGKGTIVKKLLEIDKNITVSISATTRKMRTGEIDGQSYYFLEKEEFENKIKNNEFAEFAQYAGNYYGTLCSTINEVLSSGKHLILEIEVQGAFQIKEKYPEAKLIFIMPPSMTELKSRLVNRQTEDEETIKLRLAQVDREFEQAKEFDIHIVNDELDNAVNKVKAEIYKGF